MKGNRLYKFEKICSKKSIDSLFTSTESTGYIEYPIRVVWRVKKRADLTKQVPNDCKVQFLISVPKKKLRLAVDRVKMRRKIRESFRLNKNIIYDKLEEISFQESCIIEIAFIYLSDKIKRYSTVEQRMKTLLEKISNNIKI